MWFTRGVMWFGWSCCWWRAYWSGACMTMLSRQAALIARWPRPMRRVPLRIVRALTRNGPPLSSGRRCRPVLLLVSTN